MVLTPKPNVSLLNTLYLPTCHKRACPYVLSASHLTLLRFYKELNSLLRFITLRPVLCLVRVTEDDIHIYHHKIKFLTSFKPFYALNHSITSINLLRSTNILLCQNYVFKKVIKRIQQLNVICQYYDNSN